MVGRSGGPTDLSGGCPMFVGTYTPKLDDKGRLVLPAKFREELEKGLMITRGQDHCLTIHRLEDFVALNRRLQEASLTNKRVRSYVRVLHSGPTASSLTVRAASPSRPYCATTPR